MTTDPEITTAWINLHGVQHDMPAEYAQGYRAGVHHIATLLANIACVEHHKIEPGALLVARLEKPSTQDQVAELFRVLERALPGVKVLITEPGITIEMPAPLPECPACPHYPHGEDRCAITVSHDAGVPGSCDCRGSR